MSQTYGQESGKPDSSPWKAAAAGQYLMWLALQAAGPCPLHQYNLQLWHASL